MLYHSPSSSSPTTICGKRPRQWLPMLPLVLLVLSASLQGIRRRHNIGGQGKRHDRRGLKWEGGERGGVRGGGGEGRCKDLLNVPGNEA